MGKLRWWWILVVIWGLLPLPALAQVALVGHGCGFSTTSNGFTTGSMDTSGANFIVAYLSQGNSQTNGVVTDSKSNTWTELTIASNGKAAVLFYAYNATVGSGHTFSVTGTANYPALCMAWFSGVLSSGTPFDVQNGNSAVFQPTLQSGSITPGSANELLITGVCRDSESNVPSINLSFTLADNITDNNFGHEFAAIAYQIQTTATARNPTWTTTGNSGIAVVIASFQQSGGSPPSGPAQSGMTGFWGALPIDLVHAPLLARVDYFFPVRGHP